MGVVSPPGRRQRVADYSAAHTITTADDITFEDTSGAGYGVTLPDATTCKGFRVTIYAKSLLNFLDVVTQAGQTINGQVSTGAAPSLFFGQSGDWVTLASNGTTDWKIIGTNMPLTVAGASTPVTNGMVGTAVATANVSNTSLPRYLTNGAAAGAPVAAGATGIRIGWDSNRNQISLTVNWLDSAGATLATNPLALNKWSGVTEIAVPSGAVKWSAQITNMYQALGLVARMSIDWVYSGRGGHAIYGDGSDGDWTAGNGWPFSRDAYFRNVTVPIGTSYLGGSSTGGYRMFVQGTLTVPAGTTLNVGGGTGGPNDTVGGGGAGHAGQVGAGVAPAQPAGLGGSGGAGGASGATAGGASVAALRPIVGYRNIPDCLGWIRPVNQGGQNGTMTGGVGGSSGAGDGTNLGGAGGGGGRIGVIVARNVVVNAGGVINADGFPGSAGAGGNAGGGGGGGGGCLIIVYDTLVNNGTIRAAGGAGGAGAGTGTAGSAGGAGQVILIPNNLAG